MLTCFAAFASALISAFVFGIVWFAAGTVTLTISTTSITTSALSTLSRPLESALQARRARTLSRIKSHGLHVSSLLCSKASAASMRLVCCQQNKRSGRNRGCKAGVRVGGADLKWMLILSVSLCFALTASTPVSSNSASSGVSCPGGSGELSLMLSRNLTCGKERRPQNVSSGLNRIMSTLGAANLC